MHSGEKVCLAIVDCHGLHYFLEHYRTCFHLEFYSSKEFSLANFLQGLLLLKPFLHGFLLIIISVLFVSCEEKRCIDESKIENKGCTKIYRPVCGCDNKTYGNDCIAESSGVLEWTEGECK